jgi:hypothetical protein
MLWRIERSQEQVEVVKWLAKKSNSVTLYYTKNVKPSELEVLVADYPKHDETHLILQLFNIECNLTLAISFSTSSLSKRSSLG